MDERLTATTSFAEDARRAFQTAALRARENESQLRERETLLKRLDPLRSQYADDLRKLEMLQETKHLFDALSVTVCPVCQSDLAAAHVQDGHCSLCHSVVPSAGAHAAAESGPSGDTEADNSEDYLAREKWGLGRRLDQLKSFSTDVRVEADLLRESLSRAQQEVESAQASLDSSTRAVIAPFVAQRDAIASQASRLEASLTTLARSRRLLLQLQQRENQVRQAEASLKEALARQRSLEQTHQPRDVLLASLSERLEATLTAFGYPKVEQVRLQKNLVPVVRNRRYDLVGSSGAMTLIALAWQLTIFEMSVETGDGHPGFLLIDSPQKNLRPVSVTRAPNDDEAAWILADHESIVERIYGHMQNWLDEHPAAQIIVVDNEPPELASADIVVTYSADPSSPPYGLIHNADGRKGTAAAAAEEEEVF